MRTAVIATAVSLAIVGLSVAADAGAAIRMPTDIPAQPLRPALQLLSRQRNFQLIFRTDLVGDLQTQGAVGELTVDEALTQLLSGTGLTFQYLDEKTITITKARNGAESASRSGSARSLFRLAQAPSGEQGHSEKTESMHPVEGPGSSDSRAAHERNPQPSGKEALEEIVVTGTHIRGERPVGANLIVIGREEIDRSGHTTVQSIVQALPQNFMGGGANEGTRIGGGPINVNSSAASSINLRGLGPGSTLVLLNGRRLAPAGSDASFVDVANLPASAIDRIEVLLDGASAIYGTDAVGGVVNVILKRDFEGAETRAHGGVPTQGAAREYSIGQAFGAAWQTGHALVTYDYHQRNSLPARERPFTASQDLRPWGGSDFRDTRGNPGTIVIGTQSWAIPPNQDGSALMAESLTAGTRNLYNLNETREQLPEQTLHSLFGSIRQAAGERLELTADWLLSKRDAVSVGAGSSSRISVPSDNAYYVNPTGGTGSISVDYNFVDDLGPMITDIDVRTVYGGVGADIGLPGSWRLSARVDYSRQRIGQLTLNRPITAALNAALADSNPATAFNPFGDGSFTNPQTLESIRGSTEFTSDSRLTTATLTATGTLLPLPGGMLSAAAGLEFREQQFGSSNQSSPGIASFTVRESRRDVDAAFLELKAPLVGQANGRAGVRRLALSVAARHERYSDSGSATTPAISLEWMPHEDVTLRVSRARSFKAPNLPSMDESGNLTLIQNVPDPQSPTGTSRALLWAGNGNSDLDAETSRAWAIGLDWAPSFMPGLRLGASFFDIDFENRIQFLGQLAPTFLQDPRFEAAVIREPTRDQRALACSRTTFTGAQPGDCTDSPVSALIDARTRNTSSTQEQGVDLIGSYAFDAPIGSVQLSLNATYLLRMDEALTPWAPVSDIRNTAFQPVDFRSRLAAWWTHGPWGIGSSIQYIDSYRDTLSNPNRRISSWTGVDFQLRYQGDQSQMSWLEGLSVALNVRNAFDRDPPFFNNAAGIGYDPTNTDISAVIGRTVSIHLRKDWGGRNSW